MSLEYKLSNYKKRLQHDSSFSSTSRKPYTFFKLSRINFYETDIEELSGVEDPPENFDEISHLISIKPEDLFSILSFKVLSLKMLTFRKSFFKSFKNNYFKK